jgi:hypothetical protein
MRVANATFVALLAALIFFVVPALAKNSTLQKEEEKAAASLQCRAYEQAADGTWQERPCEEVGGAAQTQHKSHAKGAGDESR